MLNLRGLLYFSALSFSIHQFSVSRSENVHIGEQWRNKNVRISGRKVRLQTDHLGCNIALGWLQMATGYPRNINRSEIDTVETIGKVETIVKLEAICLREIRDTRMDYHGIPVRNLRTASLKVPLAILHPLVFNREISTIFHQTRIYSNLPPYLILSKASSHRSFSTVRFTQFFIFNYFSYLFLRFFGQTIEFR